MENRDVLLLIKEFKAHMDCAAKIVIDIEKKLAGVYPPEISSGFVTSERIAKTQVGSLNRRNIKPKNCK